MEFSFSAWLAFELLAVGVAVASISEGTFWPTSYRRPKHPFVHHGGLLFDLAAFPLAAGILKPHFRIDSWLAVCLIGSVSAAVTIQQHAVWGEDKQFTNVFWPEHKTGNWLRDLGVAGLLHMVFMAGMIAGVLGYIVTPMPPTVVWTMFGIMALYVPCAMIQPSWYVHRRIHGRDTATMIAAIDAILVVTLIKS